MGRVATERAMDMAVKIGRMARAAVAGSASGIAPAIAAYFESAVIGNIDVAVGADPLVGRGTADEIAGVTDNAGGR